MTKKIYIFIVFLLMAMVVLSPVLTYAQDRDFGEGRSHERGDGQVFEIVSVYPADGITEIALDEGVNFVFNQDANKASVSGAFSISPGVFGKLTSVCTKNYTFVPNLGWECGKTYQVSVAGSAQSRAGVALGSDYVWSFSTVGCADDDQGNGDGGNGDTGDPGDNGEEEDNGDNGETSSIEVVNELITQGEIYEGDEVSFSIEILNSGDNTLRVVPISYSFDSEYLEFVSSTLTPSWLQVEPGASQVVWDDVTDYFGDLLSQDSFLFEITFKTKQAADEITNSVLVSGVMDEQGNELSDQESLVSMTIYALADDDQNNGQNNSGGSGSVSASTRGGGSGGYIPDPRVGLGYTYPDKKWVGKEYYEGISVVNVGGVVLTNGELILDLPEDKVNFVASNPTQDRIDVKNQIVRWSIPALGVDQVWEVNFVIEAGVAGEAWSRVDYVADQLDRYVLGREEISESSESLEGDSDGEKITENTGTRDYEDVGVGGEQGTGIIEDIEITESQNNAVTGDVIALINEELDLPSEIEIDVEQVEEAEVVDEEQVEEGEVSALPAVIEVPGEVAGVIAICASVPWWVWLIVVILHLVALIIYYYYTVLEEEEEVEENAEKKIRIVKGTWSWWWKVALCLIVIFLLLRFVGHINPGWLLGLELALYYLALAGVYALVRRAKKREWLVVPILSIAMVVVPAVVCGGWGWGAWIISGVLLALILVNYYYFMSGLKTRRLWALLPFWLTLLVIVMEVLVRRCWC